MVRFPATAIWTSVSVTKLSNWLLSSPIIPFPPSAESNTIRAVRYMFLLLWAPPDSPNELSCNQTAQPFIRKGKRDELLRKNHCEKIDALQGRC